MEKRRWVIYKRLNKINGKVYIGQTKQRNWKDRLYQEAYPSNKQVITYAINKYGVENFEDSILEAPLYSQEAADLAEMKWIEHFDSCNPEKGYNRTRGGQGVGKDTGEWGYQGKACVYLQEQMFFDSIAELSAYTGITQAHCSQVILKYEERYHAHGKYFMSLEEFEEFDSFEDAIAFIDGLRQEKKQRLLDKSADRRVELWSERYNEELSKCAFDFSSAADLAFMVKNRHITKYVIENGRDDLNMEEKWQDYIDLAKMCLSLVEKKIFIGKMKGMESETIKKEFGVEHSNEYISKIWTTQIPKTIAKEYVRIEQLKTATEFKQCSKCGKWKPTTNDFFSENKTAKDGWYSYCKCCRNKKEDPIYDLIFNEYSIYIKVNEMLQRQSLESSEEAIRKSNKRFIEVYSFTTGKLLGLCRTQKEASEKYRVRVDLISKCCSGKMENAGKYIFKWSK